LLFKSHILIKESVDAVKAIPFLGFSESAENALFEGKFVIGPF